MGSLPGRSPGRRVLAVPKGWFARLVACLPCLWLALLPPSPCPPSRREGGIKVIFMQGASPLASPRPSRKRHGLNLRCRCPKGGLPSLSPANLAFGLLSFPHPPAPLPGGKGRIKVIFMQGASPLASPRAEPMVRRITERKRFPASGAARVQPPGTCMARLVSAASGLMPGCRGRSPRRNKLWISPFPPGRGLGGWGKESKLKAGLVGDKESTLPPWSPLRQTHHTGGRGARPGKNSPPRSEKSRNPIDFCPAAWYHIYKDSPDNLHEYMAEAPKKKGRNDNALSKKTVS